MTHEEKKETIFEFLNNQKEKLSVREISKRTRISYPCVSKWVEVLKVEGRIEIEDYGNIKLVEVVANDRKL